MLELATLNGCGGRRGKSNWSEDKDDEQPALYRALPPDRHRYARHMACHAMLCCLLRYDVPPDSVAPFNRHLAEIRCIDVPAANLEQHKAHRTALHSTALCGRMPCCAARRTWRATTARRPARHVTRTTHCVAVRHRAAPVLARNVRVCQAGSSTLSSRTRLPCGCTTAREPTSCDTCSTTWGATTA